MLHDSWDDDESYDHHHMLGYPARADGSGLQRLKKRR
jgi:hypothetical protein